MAFELSQAYVSLTNQGFDQTIKDTEGVEFSLRKLMASADDATQSVDKGLVDAMVNAAGEMLTTTANTKRAADEITRAKNAVLFLQSKIAALEAVDLRVNDEGLKKALALVSEFEKKVEDLDSLEIDFVESLAQTLDPLIAAGEETRRLTEAVNAFDLQTKKPKKSVEELNAEIAETKKQLGGATDGVEDFVNAAVKVVDVKFDKAFESAAADAEKIEQHINDIDAKEAEQLRIRLEASKAAVLAMAVGFANFLQNIPKTDFGLGAAVARADELRAKLKDVTTERTRELAANAESLDILQQQRAVQLKNVVGKEKSKAAEFERADNTGSFVERTANDPAVIRKRAIQELKTEQEKLKIIDEQIVKFREEAAAAEEKTKQRAAKLAADLKAKEKADAESLQKSFQSQLETTKLQTLELTKGKEAAAQVRDIIAGFTPEMRAQLSIARQQNAAAVMRKEKADEAAKLADQEKKRQDNLNRSFAQQANALAAKNIALQKGNEAAERFKAEAKGFTTQQRAQLAVLRERNRLLNDLDEAKKNEAKINEAADKTEGSFVGFADLAKAGAGNVESQQAQKETARATAALAKQAANEGIKIKDLATAAPRVDRRFGRGKGGA